MDTSLESVQGGGVLLWSSIHLYSALLHWLQHWQALCTQLSSLKLICTMWRRPYFEQWTFLQSWFHQPYQLPCTEQAVELAILKQFTFSSELQVAALPCSSLQPFCMEWVGCTFDCSLITSTFALYRWIEPGRSAIPIHWSYNGSDYLFHKYVFFNSL